MKKRRERRDKNMVTTRRHSKTGELDVVYNVSHDM